MKHELDGQDLLDELVFLLGPLGGMTAIEAAAAVGRSVPAIDVLLRNARPKPKYAEAVKITGAEVSLGKRPGRKRGERFWAA